MASYLGNIEIVEYTLEHDANINFLLNGSAPIFFAFSSNNSELMRFLLSNGADPRSVLRTQKGPLPLSLAIQSLDSELFNDLQRYFQKE